MAERRLLSRDAEATMELARRLGAGLPAGSVLALDGELGAGKTLFVRGLARGLEVEEPVSSPTYTLMHEYPGRLTLYHMDAWMEGRERAFLEGGGADWLDAGGVCVIEWAERVRELLPPPFLAVRLEHVDAASRRLVLAVQGGAAGARGRLQEALEALLEGLELPAEVEEIR